MRFDAATAAAATWNFVAGDSRRAPLAVAFAVLVALALERAHVARVSTALAYGAIIAGGLVAAAFEGSGEPPPAGGSP